LRVKQFFQRRTVSLNPIPVVAFRHADPSMSTPSESFRFAASQQVLFCINGRMCGGIGCHFSQ
jgi:hypothetical protein